MTRVLNQLGSTTISDFNNITYDAVGNRTSLLATVSGASSLNGTTTFAYDTKNQLLEQLTTRYGGFTDSFSYDAAGNPTSFLGTSKSYNSNNQQTGTGFSYDNNGNPIAYNGVSLTFDPENHLIAHGSTLSAGYSGDGLRAWKQISSGRVYFLYDGNEPVVEIDSAGSVIATNSFTSTGLVSRRVGTASVLYAFDAEGNVAQRTDASASVLSNHLFRAYGDALNGSLSEPFGYRAKFGYYTDTETGLQLLTNRYYDSQAGRFLTRDPIGYEGGINLYSYVANNPPNAIDPSGHNPGVMALPAIGWGAAEGGGIAAGAAAAAPVAAVAGVGAIAFVATWPLGESIARAPWNPFTHPADPVLPHPDCSPRIIPLDGPITMTAPDTPDKEESCDEEWDRAYERCAETIGNPTRRPLTGGYSNLEDCARGLVSQRCGGNRVN